MKLGNRLLYTTLIVAVSIQTGLAADTKEKSSPDSSTTTESDNKLLDKEIVDYFTANPEQLEAVLVAALQERNVTKLEKLLPLYATYPNRDDSVIDWGNAIIYASKGDYKNAVNLYRKVNSRLPDAKLLRFQMAVALLENKQYIASKKEFEKLRSIATSEKELELYNGYLDRINQNNEWDISVGLSIVNDPNINNAAGKGTKLVTDDGSVITSNAEKKHAMGLSYSLSANKDWSIKDNFFITLNSSLSGNYYWNYKEYNDLDATLGLGLSYKNARMSISAIPYIQNKWYVDDEESNHSLDQYGKAIGLRLNQSYWFTPKIRHSIYGNIKRNKYIDSLSHLDDRNISLSNSILYVRNANQYFYGGFNIGKNKPDDDISTYNTVGANVGWGQSWPHGISTNLGVSVNKRNYKHKDFFGVKKENTSLSFNTSLWHRSFHFGGLTPKLNWQYSKTDSNNPFHSYDKHNVFLELSKDF